MSRVGEQVGEQLQLGSMPTRLFSCTPSRLTTFDCPRRYRMTYLDRPTPPRGAPWAHNTMGAVVHLALHRWWQLGRPKRNPENGGWLVERHWQHDGFRDLEQSLTWRSRAKEWVEQYLRGVDADDEPVGVERTVGTRTDRLAVSGRVDRIDGRDGELVIVDYKTGRSIPGEDDARGSLALALYALGARRTLRQACRRVELHHLPSGSVAAFEHTDESLQRHIARAEACAEDIVAATDTLAGLLNQADAQASPTAAPRPPGMTADETAIADDLFPAVPGAQCGWCDFRRNCPTGLASSRSLDSWSGLAEVAG
ncbi:PD-(D/E)XK nuclease superfamily protein [Jatrophihabitans sp. GAS493]|uniref:RecB family exonuclease n=1 Tax=Jatrophihabitans sp. GAS493 TaxID=1907575 RepID=UPI000BC08223|nr:PD-(D/E)XK nuclease family protein [Jatrophihabitans sp. GAS493]SOD73163.1 PD-(D/E)XK nuclease superfamily protein [Jatrophihabitans sp. GAS493]